MTMTFDPVKMMNEAMEAIRQRHEEAKRNAPLRVPDKAGPVPDGDGGWTARRAWLGQMPSEGSPRLRVWLMEVPGAHAFWCHWIVSLVHLRPMEGVRPAVKAYPEAEYELSVMALDPQKPIDIDVKGDFTLLQPLDLVFQFHGVSDANAVALADWYVENVMTNPTLSPDSDFKALWQRRLAIMVDTFQKMV